MIEAEAGSSCSALGGPVSRQTRDCPREEIRSGRPTAIRPSLYQMSSGPTIDTLCPWELIEHLFPDPRLAGDGATWFRSRYSVDARTAPRLAALAFEDHRIRDAPSRNRSEEHTSELQSLMRI